MQQTEELQMLTSVGPRHNIHVTADVLFAEPSIHFFISNNELVLERVQRGSGIRVQD